MGTATAEDDATYQFLDEAAFAGVRALVGLDAVEYAITGAAPIPAELISWYRAIGVPLSEIYGMSESTGPDDLGAHPGEGRHRRRGLPRHRLLPRRRRRGVHPGRQRVPRLPRRPGEDGRGARPRRHPALGRHRRSSTTRATCGSSTARRSSSSPPAGKNISPANLEAELKMIPLIAQACAIGDQKPFVSALVVLDAEVAPVWAKEHGIEFASLAELAEHPDVIAEVDKGVAEAMAGFNNAERVKKVKILHEEWLARLRGAHADLEAQAPRHPRQVRRGDRGAVRVARGGRPPCREPGAVGDGDPPRVGHPSDRLHAVLRAARPPPRGRHQGPCRPRHRRPGARSRGARRGGEPPRGPRRARGAAGSTSTCWPSATWRGSTPRWARWPRPSERRWEPIGPRPEPEPDPASVGADLEAAVDGARRADLRERGAARPRRGQRGRRGGRLPRDGPRCRRERRRRPGGGAERAVPVRRAASSRARARRRPTCGSSTAATSCGGAPELAAPSSACRSVLG